MTDQPGLFAGANITINIETMNILSGDGAEQYNAPVQVNQYESPTAAVPPRHAASAVDRTPRCRYCGWSDSLYYDAEGYYHPDCKQAVDDADERAQQRATDKYWKDAPVAIKAFEILESRPDIPPEPEPEPESMHKPSPRNKTLFEELDERYAASYAELRANGVKHGQAEADWLAGLKSGVRHDAQGRPIFDW